MALEHLRSFLMELVIARCKLWPKQESLGHLSRAAALMILLPLSVVRQTCFLLVKPQESKVASIASARFSPV